MYSWAAAPGLPCSFTFIFVRFVISLPDMLVIGRRGGATNNSFSPND
jgi:hypothetical protein